MASNGRTDANDDHFLEIVPNCSMTPRGALVFFCWVSAMSLGIALVFVAFGFWPVLPFAGLEMLVLGIALRLSIRRGSYREVVRIGRRDIEVRRRAHDATHRRTFQRAWTRVRLVRSRVSSHPSRLEIGSHGRWLEVGACLTETERLGLKSRLDELIDQHDGAVTASA